jgi:hypothetical protein
MDHVTELGRGAFNKTAIEADGGALKDKITSLNRGAFDANVW